MNLMDSNKINFKTNSIDLLFVTYSFLLINLTIIFSDKISNWESVLINFVLIIIAYILLGRITYFLKSDFLKVFWRALIIAITNGLIFSEIRYLQHIIVNGWMDQSLINFDNWLFGIELTIAMDKITTPLLTEVMMFAYTIYVPLIVLVALFCYKGSGRSAGEEYLFLITITYFLSYLGFLVYPVKGPLFYQPEVYNNPLEGWIFTYLGEWIRQNAHYPGGNLPSPHCAAGTIMLLLLNKYNKKYFYIVLPVIILLYLSTVYGRYHYAMDGVLGILLAFLIYFIFRKIPLNLVY